MTYPPSSPGYPPAPQSGSQYGATQPFGKPAETAPAGRAACRRSCSASRRPPA